ncbi:MAG TPA: nitroreductase family deazaflavin-dependent oxidoreductase [Anaerolineae bacterium]|nr:nitroreductase family deazaflavin-dependent oxidoreductase [Anaerolineae bacterium]
MPSKKQLTDSPKIWVAKHIQDYVNTDGKKGHKWNGHLTLLLTTRGRKSGVLRRTALIYGTDGDNYLLVASNGGSDSHPNWYLNLMEDPKVELQVGAEKFKAKARVANEKEKPRLWKIMTKVFPTYNRYQKNTEREIPLIILERRSR